MSSSYWSIDLPPCVRSMQKIKRARYIDFFGQHVSHSFDGIISLNRRQRIDRYSELLDVPLSVTSRFKKNKRTRYIDPQHVSHSEKSNWFIYLCKSIDTSHAKLQDIPRCVMSWHKGKRTRDIDSQHVSHSFHIDQFSALSWSISIEPLSKSETTWKGN